MNKQHFGLMPTTPAQPSPVKPGWQHPSKDPLAGALGKLCPGKVEGVRLDGYHDSVALDLQWEHVGAAPCGGPPTLVDEDGNADESASPVH